MMTLEEFKAWFEGYCEAIEGAPTPAQWEKVKAKLADTVALRVPVGPTYYNPPLDISPAVAPYKPPYEVTCGGFAPRTGGFAPMCGNLQ